MAINTLDELKYYCNEKDPAGALMLIGEWGCGKTYLIDHTLSESLKNSHIFIRISLFGISSMDAVITTIKRSWIEENLKNKGKGGEFANRFFNLKNRFAPLIKAISDKAGAVLSFDIAEIVPISNRIDNKVVVLVFDDLERCRIDSVDLLGVINDYCENQHFHTIIVANEEYILSKNRQKSVADTSNRDSEKDPRKDSDTTTTTKHLSYTEIKEKIVQRTVKIVPDYNSIIQSVIENYTAEDKEYKHFLVDQTEGLQNLFDVGIPMTETAFKASDITKETLVNVQSAHNPHNIRSFRCAIQDFHRVFKLLRAHGITELLDEWLYAFVMFTMAHRTGVVAGNERYGNIFTDVEVSQLYPSFYKDRYMLDFEKAWILHGEWDEEIAAIQIKKLKERQQATTPYDIARTYQLIYTDEDVFNEGFPQVLEKAYSGELAIDDYIQLIRNTASARLHQFELPVSVDWSKVKLGIQKKLESMMQQGEEDTHTRQYIGDNNLDILTEEERNAYILIDEFRKGEKLIFAKNRKEFLQLMEKDHIMALSKAKNKRFECFDEEMANSVVQSFIRCSNFEKANLVRDFKGLWESNLQSPDIDSEKTLEGFKFLQEKLLEVKENVDKTKAIALSHFDSFIALTSDLIAKLNAQITEIEKA